jgi:CrcB protein
MQAYVLVAIGSALGGVSRHWLSGLVASHTTGQFPWGTILVNVLGSFVIGLANAVTGPTGRFGMDLDARLFIMVGLCGGFTTFSSFSLQTLALLETGHAMEAGANVLLSVAICLLSVWLGHVAGTMLNG